MRHDGSDAGNSCSPGSYIMSPTLGSGKYKYGEYQYVCTSSQIVAKKCFSDIDMYQLFDLTTDPFEQHNVYNETDLAIKEELAHRLRLHYPCSGASCP